MVCFDFSPDWPPKNDSIVSVLQKLIWFRKYEHHFRHFFHFYQYDLNISVHLENDWHKNELFHFSPLDEWTLQAIRFLSALNRNYRTCPINKWEKNKPEKMKHPSLWLWLRNIMLNSKEKKNQTNSTIQTTKHTNIWAWWKTNCPLYRVLILCKIQYCSPNKFTWNSC